MNIINELHNLGINLKNRSSGQIKTICPKCSHTRKKKSDPCLSVNIDQGYYNCHNCQWSGSVMFKKKIDYVLPKINPGKLSDKIIDYFKSRAISMQTLIDFKITESMKYFSALDRKTKAINFNYYRDNELINIKYRDSRKNFSLEKNAELIFYNLDQIKDQESCYIVEGEIDALSLHEAGIKNVISVPNGASSGSQKLDYLDNCIKYFNNKNEIILCCDNDDPGLALRNELARRLGKYRCKYIDLNGFKDANEALISIGILKLLELLENNRKSFPLDGVLDLDTIWNDVISFNNSGIKNFTMGFDNADSLLKIAMGEWSVITGVPNSGKSDFCDQILCNMAVKHGFRSAMFAPESFPYESHIKRISDKLNKRSSSIEDLNNTRDFINDHFSWIKIDLKDLTLEKVLKHFKELVYQKGVNLFVIDPYNMLNHNFNADHSYHDKILSLLTQFVQQTNTHLFLIAHPRKLESENGIYKKATLYDISGSASFFNKCFNGIVVVRELGSKTEYGSDLVRVYIDKVKRKDNGMLGSFDLAPDFKAGGSYKELKQQTKPILNKTQIPF